MKNTAHTAFVVARLGHAVLVGDLLAGVLDVAAGTPIAGGMAYQF